MVDLLDDHDNYYVVIVIVVVVVVVVSMMTIIRGDADDRDEFYFHQGYVTDGNIQIN